MATGGSIAHMLAVDYALKPVLSALKAQEILQGLFAEDSQIAYGEGNAQAQLVSALEATLARSLGGFPKRSGSSSQTVGPNPIE